MKFIKNISRKSDEWCVGKLRCHLFWDKFFFPIEILILGLREYLIKLVSVLYSINKVKVN